MASHGSPLPQRPGVFAADVDFGARFSPQTIGAHRMVAMHVGEKNQLQSFHVEPQKGQGINQLLVIVLEARIEHREALVGFDHVNGGRKHVA